MFRDYGKDMKEEKQELVHKKQTFYLGICTRVLKKNTYNALNKNKETKNHECKVLQNHQNSG
jgi:hypothetical protein